MSNNKRLAQAIKIEVIFKHTLFDKVRNLFVSKRKQFPRVALFEGYDTYSTATGDLSVRWGRNRYVYPMHKIERMKFTYPE